MIRATATELNKRPGKLITQAIREPIVIEKSSHPIVVMVPYDLFIKLEDSYWGELAHEADQEPSLGTQQTMDFLQRDH